MDFLSREPTIIKFFFQTVLYSVLSSRQMYGARTVLNSQPTNQLASLFICV